MKKTILTLSLAFVSTFAMAQQTIQWNHGLTGFTPTGTITVDCNEIFHFTSGGNIHPVVEGGSGITTVSNFWSSLNLTVAPSNNSSNPLVVSIPDTGEYYFRCGTNPGNSNLFGHITVAGPTCEGTTAVEVVTNHPINIYPNPVTDVLTIEGLNGTAEVFDINGKKVMNTNGTVNVSNLANGTYIIKAESFTTNFIKE